MSETAGRDDRYLDHPYELSGRLIDPIGGSATCAGQRHALNRKQLEVLACLASAGDTMVARRAFIERVWDGNALVGETGLTNAIYALRRSLQDDDAGKPLIRTIPRRGYQLTVRPRMVGVDTVDTFSAGAPIAGKPGWHLSRRLDRHAVGETWLAEERDTGTQRAFRFCRSEEHLRLLRRETKIMRYLRETLGHRGDIAVIADWQLDEPPYYLEMEHAAHGRLAQWAATRGGFQRIAPQERLRLVGQIADALAAVHAAGVVHRRVGAGSVLIDADHGRPDGAVRARLGEFGGSDLIDRARLIPLQITSSGLTLTGDEGQDERVYLAPECLAGELATGASDVHALGVLLMQCATGDLQRGADGGWEGDVESSALKALISACVDPEPGRRPTAAEVSRRLHAIESGAATDTVADAPARLPDPPPPAPVDTIAPASLVGRTIGPYRVLDRLGEGGMGVVYLAEQRTPVQRTVALKLIRADLDSRQVLDRFEAERQALALMSHANVATVYDAGDTPAGQPYFAMEYVRGREITTHCDELRLDFRERIVLFLQACEGVLHAHQKGLIHRDIKPGNILVSRMQDQPATIKIIDFGVAKSLSGVLGGHAAHTRVGSFVGTPAYSSPEQISGPVVNVDTRTDIYSLGVVLYQLLAGVTPYSDEELNRKTPVELARLLSTEHPPSLLARFTRLSAEEEDEIARHRSLSIERMKASLGSDISWIVGKCLECDPDDRYPSVLELEKDLQRWLDDKPIEARPTSRNYRMRKFVRRHRPAVAAVTLATLALLITSTAAVVGFVRARHALEDARTANAEAEMAAAFQVKQIQSIDPTRMGDGIRRDLLEAVRVQDLRRGLEPDAIAQSRQRLNAVFEGVNFTDLALNQLDSTFFKPALDDIRKNYADHPVLQAKLWQTMSDTLRDQGRLEEAVEPQRLALDQLRRQLGPEHRLALMSLRSRGLLNRERGKLDTSAADIETAMKTMRRVLGDDDPETITSIHELGNARYTQGDYAAAESLYREALARSRRVLGKDDPSTVESMASVGQALYAQRKFEEALPYARENLASQRRLQGNGSPDTLNAINFVAALYWGMDKLSDAIPLAREAVAGMRKARGEEHPDTLAMTDNLAIMLRDAGQYPEAETLLRHSLGIEDRIYSPDNPNRLATLEGLGGVLLKQGRLDEAEQVVRQVYAGKVRSLGEDHPDTLLAADNLASVLGQQGKNDEAIAIYGRTLTTMRRVLGNEHPQTLLATRHLAARFQEKGEFNAAATLLQETLEIQRRTLGRNDTDTLATLTDLGALAKAQGDLARSETMLRESLAGYRGTVGIRDASTLVTIARLMEVLRERGKLQETLALGKELTDIAPAVLDARDHRLGKFFLEHAKTLVALHRFPDAERMLAQAKGNFLQGDPPPGSWTRQLVENGIRLQEEWDKAEPGTGHAAKAADWRNALDALTTGQAQPKEVLVRQ